MAGFIGFPDQRGFVGMLWEVPVDTINTHIEFTAFKPAEVALSKITRLHGMPGGHPIEVLGVFSPEVSIHEAT